MRGFIVKDAPAEKLADRIRRIASDQRVIDPDLIAAALETGSSPVTMREAEVLRQRNWASPPRRSARVCRWRQRQCGTTSRTQSRRSEAGTVSTRSGSHPMRDGSEHTLADHRSRSTCPLEKWAHSLDFQCA